MPVAERYLLQECHRSSAILRVLQRQSRRRLASTRCLASEHCHLESAISARLSRGYGQVFGVDLVVLQLVRDLEVAHARQCCSQSEVVIPLLASQVCRAEPSERGGQ